MKYTEVLNWILDPIDESRKDDARYQANIDFVHSLGLKCDCVGWSTLKLSDPRTEEILEAIRAFCQKDGWRARGVYTKTCVESDSDWYELVCRSPKFETVAGGGIGSVDKARKVSLFDIRAYHETDPSPKYIWGQHMVPERFRNACLRHEINSVNFCWARDRGRYHAEQYFFLQSEHWLPRIWIGYRLNVTDRDSMNALGGYLPRLAEVFYDLLISIPNQYYREDIPNSGFTCAYLPYTDTYGEDVILIHKTQAQVLLAEKAIPAKALRPAVFTDTAPVGYTLKQCEQKPTLQPDYIQNLQAEYEALKANPRPVRATSEKDALKMLRKAKRERKEDFRKAMPKAQAEALSDTPYRALLPYYLVADGGLLSDEYQLYSRQEALAADAEFQAELKKEELAEGKPEGVVFGRCTDGDTLLLCSDGSVLRFSHEGPEATMRWPNPAQFIFESISDIE